MKTLQDLMDEVPMTEEFGIGEARIYFIAQVLGEMERQGIRRADLARITGIKHQRVSEIFLSNHSLTFTTAVRIARALGMRFSPELKKEKL